MTLLSILPGIAKKVVAIEMGLMLLNLTTAALDDHRSSSLNQRLSPAIYSVLSREVLADSLMHTTQNRSPIAHKQVADMKQKKSGTQHKRVDDKVEPTGAWVNKMSESRRFKIRRLLLTIILASRTKR